jgi:hypothetical protein
MKTRTAAQVEASRMNGAKGHGAITLAGKETSSLNALKGGLGAEALLLPHESAERYGMVVSSWVDALRPGSSAEARLVARVADVDFRLQRLASMEQKAVLAEAEKLVEETAPAKELSAHRTVKQMISAMAQMAETTKISTQPTGALDGVLKAIRLVVDQLIAIGVDIPEVGLVSGMVRQLVLEELTGDVDEAWKRFGQLARVIEVELTKRMTAFEEAVQAAKNNILEDLALGDEVQLRRLHRHRAALQKELDQVLCSIKTIRDLAGAAPNQIPDRLVEVHVELRVAGVLRP